MAREDRPGYMNPKPLFIVLYLHYSSPTLTRSPHTQAYTLLVLWSPTTIIPRPSEKFYRSARNPSELLPLPSVHDSPRIQLTVVIPAYNETARLPEMFASTLAHLEAMRTEEWRTYEVLVVDDGSSDGTADLALKLGATYEASAGYIRVVVLEKNVGKGGAVRHGMLHGRGRRFLMVDADGASRFEDLEALWEEMNEIAPRDAAGVVVGSRAHLVKTDAVVKVRYDSSYFEESTRAELTHDSPALVPPQRPHVRLAHDLAHCRRRTHTGHAVRL